MPNAGYISTPLAWDVLAGIARMVFKKLECILGCGKAGSFTLTVIELCVLFICMATVFFFIPLFMLIYCKLCQLIKSYGCGVQGQSNFTNVALNKDIGETVLQILVGIGGAIALNSAIAYYKECSHCINELKCDQNGGILDKYFYFFQVVSVQFCHDRGLCYDIGRNCHWLLLPIVAYGINWFVIQNCCSPDDDGPDDNGDNGNSDVSGCDDDQPPENPSNDDCPCPPPDCPPNRLHPTPIFRPDIPSRVPNTPNVGPQGNSMNAVRNAITTSVTERVIILLNDLARTSCQQCRERIQRIIQHVRGNN